MAFPRARLRRFNDTQEKTPGVGAYNLTKGLHNDKSSRINETLMICKENALVAAGKGQLPKHVEEIHAKYSQAKERVVELEILKIGWDKQRELTETEKDDLKQRLTKLEAMQEKCKKAEKDKHELEKQVSSHLLKIQHLEQQEHQLQLNMADLEKRKEGNEKDKLKLASELDKLKKNHTETENNCRLHKEEISDLKKSLFNVQIELDSNKKEYDSLKLKQENKAQHFKNEKQALTAQIESANHKCSEWENKFKASSEANAQDIGALLEANLQKVSEIEEKKKAMENLELYYKERMKQMTEQEHILKERLVKLEETHVQLEKESATLAQDLGKCEDEKKRVESENIELTQKLEEASKETERHYQRSSDLEKQLKESIHIIDRLKLEKDNETQNFEKEKAAFTSQIESLNSKTETWEDKCKISSEKYSLEVEALQEVNATKIVEMQDRNKVLEDLVSQAESIKDQLQAQQEELQLKHFSLVDSHQKLKKEFSVITQDLTNRLVLSGEEKKRSEFESKEQMTKLEQASEDIEELTQHLIFTQDKLQGSIDEIKKLKDTHQKETQEFENERQFLNSQVQSFILKCEEWEDKVNKINKTCARENESLREGYSQQLFEIEEKNRKLQDLLSQVEKDKEKTQAEEHQLREKLNVLENAQIRLERESSALAQDITQRLIISEEKNKTLEMESDSLMQKLEDALEKVEKMEQENSQALEDAKASYSERLTKMATDNANFQHAQEQLWTEKQLSLEEENRQLQTKCNETLAENNRLEQRLSQQEKENDDLGEMLESYMVKIEAMEKESSLALDEARVIFSEKLAEVERDNNELHQEQEQVWQKQCASLEDENKQLQVKCIYILTENERLEQRLSQRERESDDVRQILNSYAQKIETVEKESSLALEEANALFSEKLAKVAEDKDRLCQENELVWQQKCSTLEEEKQQLASKVNLLEEENSQLQDKYDETSSKTELAQHLSEKEVELASLKEENVRFLHNQEDLENQVSAADQEIQGLNNIISEMSDKIEQMECEKAEIVMEIDEDWRGKYEDLVTRMEPFKEILEGFELEKQLLHDKDKFTTEQLEKLTQECIKNMGHQNHKQRIKYLDKIKQENLNLCKTVHELQEQNLRHEANIKKLKGKSVEKTENIKPRQRAPLKEGNHL